MGLVVDTHRRFNIGRINEAEPGESDPNIPVVYVTGYSPAEPRLVPGSRFFCKPYSPEQVIAAIRELLLQKSAQ
jgi:hypothetical protein